MQLGYMQQAVKPVLTKKLVQSAATVNDNMLVTRKFDTLFLWEIGKANRVRKRFTHPCKEQLLYFLRQLAPRNLETYG